MTRKHFQRIAAALRLCKPDRIHFEEDDNYRGAMRDWRKAVADMRRMCAESNTNFDGNKFLDACGFDD